MKDYARIAAKICETPWLITESGLTLITSIVEARINNGKLSDEELAFRMDGASRRGSGLKSGSVSADGKIGVLPVYGPIFGKANLMTEMSGATSMETFRKDLKTMLADPSIQSILLDIDSPGGSSEMIAEAADEIFAARDIKPVYAVANSMAGSAAFYLMSQATKGYVTPSGSVGSIGVYTVHEDQSAADAKQGVKYTFISAGPYKTEGNPHQPLSQEGEAYRQEVVNEIYQEFLTVVGRGRGISAEEVQANYGGGRMLTAKRALDAGMVDGIMEFDAVVESLASNPAPATKMTVVFGKDVMVTDTEGNQMAALEYIQSFDGNDVVIDDARYISVADYEHSDPGTGQPPAPRVREDKDIAIESGSRRPDVTRGIPNEADEPGAPKANAVGGNTMDLEQLLKLYGLQAGDEEKLLELITEDHKVAMQQALSNQLSAEEAQLAEKFPEAWKRIQADREKTLNADAAEFAASNLMLTRLEGDKPVETKFGLSTLANDMVKDTYLKIAKGEFSLSDFTECITTITHGGILEYGENGSSLEENLPEFATGGATARNAVTALFANKISEIQRADKLSYADAYAEACTRYPDLAEQYKSSIPVR